MSLMVDDNIKMSTENYCNNQAQEHMKQICGDLCKLEGKMQRSNFLDFVVSEVSKYLVITSS